MSFVPLTAAGFPLMGRVSNERADTLRGRYGAQWVPIELGMGAKLSETLYLGGYVGMSVGVEGSDPRIVSLCDDNDNDFDNDIGCSSGTLRAGIEARYSFAPAARWSPWVGYGFGGTAAWQSISDNRGYAEDVWVTGIDWARLSGGVDWRLARGLGLGPYLTTALGRYTSTSTRVGNEQVFKGALPEPGFHSWLELGFRGIVMP